MSAVQRGGGRRGQALVEFALIAPIFFLLVFGLIEFGRAVYTIQILDNAAREGARYAIVHGASSNCPSGPMPNGDANYCDPAGTKIASVVRRTAIGVGGVNSSDLVVTSRWCANVNTCTSGLGNGTNARNQSVVVRVAYTYRTLLPLVPLPDFTLTGGSTLVINH
jgi:Flp pilus assembly protein TadG